MSQRYRREGGQDGDRRPSRGNERGSAQRSHQESSDPGPSERADEESRTTTRTEAIDRKEGLRPEPSEPGDEELPECRQKQIEFLERQYHDAEATHAPARREELLREGCQVLVREWSLGWFQQSAE